MTFQEIIQSKQLTELLLGTNLIEEPNEYFNASGLNFEFSINNTFSLAIYQFIAEIHTHLQFSNSMRNGQFIIEFYPGKDILIQKILLTIELYKEFNLAEIYESLVFEIKRLGLNTKIETTLNENKEVISESIVYLSSPEESPLHIGFYYSIQGEEVNHFVVDLVRAFDKNKFNSFLKGLGLEAPQKTSHNIGYPPEGSSA
jgi:hypothetical protein